MSARLLVGDALLVLGVALILLAGVGVLRLPDVLTRANAATKATGLGLAAVLLGAAVRFDDPRAWVVLGAAVLVQFATSPVSGHVIGRAAYRSGAPLWEGTTSDDLRGWYAAHPRHARRVSPRPPHPAQPPRPEPGSADGPGTGPGGVGSPDRPR